MCGSCGLANGSHLSRKGVDRGRVVVNAWPQKLDYELRRLMEQFTKHEEGRFNGQDT